MKLADHLISRAVSDANGIVDELDRRGINFYISGAKLVLWLITFVLLGIIAAGVTVGYVQGFHVGVMSVVVQACQAIALVVITVLGYHGYKGSRVLHLLRHLHDYKNENQESK